MQIQAFLFPDLGNQTNRSILISNMTLVFLNFFPKNTQINHFWSQIQAFLFFRKILKLEKFEDAAFKYDNIVFKFQPKTTQIKHFWFHIQALFVRFIFCVFFFFFWQNFPLDKFGVLISNIKLASLKLQPKNTQIRHFWSQIQAFLFFRKILRFNKFEGEDFKYDYIFKNFNQKLPREVTSSVPELDIFVILQNLVISQIREY